MNIQSAFDAGVAGFNNASALANESASKIAEYSEVNATPKVVKNERSLEVEAPISLTEELVNLKVAEHQALASAKVITTADEVVGSLIDTRV